MTLRALLLSQLGGSGLPLAEVDLQGHTSNTAYQILYRMIAAGEVSSRVERRPSSRGDRDVVVYRTGEPETDEELRRRAGAVAYLNRKTRAPAKASGVRALLSTGDGRDFTLALIWATAGRRMPR